jgi:hypothetical protein
MARLAAARVGKAARWTSSFLSVTKRLSIGASKQFQRRLIEQHRPCLARVTRCGSLAYCTPRRPFYAWSRGAWPEDGSGTEYPRSGRTAGKSGNFGAARLGRLALGQGTTETVLTEPAIADVIEPDPALADAYRPRIEAFRRLYAALRQEFRARSPNEPKAP